MGGTSFDVGLVHDGRPVASYQSVVNQYEYFVPRIDIRSIGSGGGSIIWVDETSGSLRVGPLSAGRPGPVCYGRGGTEPTVTDAAVALGYLDPDYFLGGRLRLDGGAARQSLEPIAQRLGMSVVEAASGAARVVEHQMADLIRKVTVHKGYDPRDFAVFAYGGAGPVHAGVYARELGAQSLIVPLGGVCSLWSALGAATADLLHIYETVDILASPFDAARVTERFAELERQGLDQLERDGIAPGAARIARSADMRYKGQINEVEVAVPAGELDEAALAELAADFHRRYEALYGAGAGFREARVEIVTYRVRTTAVSAKPAIRPVRERGATPSGDARAARAPCTGPSWATSSSRRCSGASGSSPAIASRGRPSSRSRTRPSSCIRGRPRGSTPTATCSWTSRPPRERAMTKGNICVSAPPSTPTLAPAPRRVGRHAPHPER